MIQNIWHKKGIWKWNEKMTSQKESQKNIKEMRPAKMFHRHRLTKSKKITKIIDKNETQKNASQKWDIKIWDSQKWDSQKWD